MYAIVRFADELDSVSEVPVSWLSNNSRKCWWPPGNTKNVSVYITKAVPPNTNIWEQHDVIVETTGVSIETARKKSEDADYTSSEELQGRSMRKSYKTNDHESSDDSESCYLKQRSWGQTTNVMMPPLPPSLPAEFDKP